MPRTIKQSNKPIDITKIPGYVDPSLVSNKFTPTQTVSQKPLPQVQQTANSSVPTTDFSVQNNRQIPIDTLNQPVTDFSSINRQLAFNTVAPVNNFSTVSQQRPTQTNVNFRSQVQQNLLKEISRNDTDTINKIREESRISEKEKVVSKLENDLRRMRLDYESERQRLETENEAGKSMSAIGNDINNLTRDYNRNLAYKSVEFDVANDDYASAENTVNNAIQSIREERDNNIRSYETMLTFLQNDMSESEKFQAQKNHEFNLLNYENDVRQLQSFADSQIADSQAQNYANSVSSGVLTIDKVPKEYLSGTLNILNNSGYVSPEESKRKIMSGTVISNIDNLLGDGGLGLFTTGSPIKRGIGNVFQFFGGADRTTEAERIINNIISNVGLDLLPTLKGPASDKDVEFVTNAASKLSTDLDPTEFINNLIELRSTTVRGMLENPGISLDVKKSLLTKQTQLENPNESKQWIADTVNATLEALPNYLRGEQLIYNSVNIPQSSRLAYVNNNPGNLRFAGQQGAFIGQGGFAGFSTPDEGYGALLNQISLDQQRGHTISSFVSKFAPPTENDTRSYIKFVSEKTGYPPNTKIVDIPVELLGKAVALKESSTIIS